MSALGSLKGVGCAVCGLAGHFCQAQMWMDCEAGTEGLRDEGRGDEGLTAAGSEKIAVCLRCADGEPCYAVTVGAVIVPARLAEDVDLCAVPAMTAADRAYIARQGNEVNVGPRGKILIGEALRVRMLEDLKTMSTEDVAKKYYISKVRVLNLRSNQRAKEKVLARQRMYQAESRVIGGEQVRIAPMSSMGAEMLGQVTGDRLQMTVEKPPGPAVKRVRKARALWGPQVLAVMKAVGDGCQTAAEVMTVTGIPQAVVAAILCRLNRIGRLRVVGTTPARKGGRAYLYGLIENAA